MAEKTKNEKFVERTMQVRAISFNKGLVVFNQVKLIRIISKDYNLVIMTDYLPTLGGIDGDVTIVSAEGETKLSGIKGYYVNKANIFSLVIEGEMSA